MKGSDVTKKVELEMKLKNEQMRIHIEKDWNDLLLNELHDKKEILNVILYYYSDYWSCQYFAPNL